jgi:V8-like Glu-specific endopeptidase
MLTLTQAAIDGDLFEIDRSLLLQGIPKGYTLSLKMAGNPLDQFQMDLHSVNGVERLSDGQVPIVRFLKNAANQLAIKGRAQASIFERVAGLLDNCAQGIVRLPEPSALQEVVRREVIIGRDDMVDLAFLQRGLTVAKSVARILVPRFEKGKQVYVAGGAPWCASGTAWLIAPGLAITNHHVINARRSDELPAEAADFLSQGQHASIDFDFDFTESARTTAKVVKVEAASGALDYAILRIAAALPRPALSLLPNKLVTDATAYIAVNIIQHPRGEPKRIAFRNNLVTGADDIIVRYFTDTDFGSSGSPVCDDTWRVVALHRGAKPVDDVEFQGKHTAFVNFGTQIQAVLQDLQPALLDEIREAQKGGVVDT